MEIEQLRTYNSKSFATKNTRERCVFNRRFIRREWLDELKTEFYVKPIHYVRQDMTWGNLDEIASYFGNRNGMVLKQGWEEKADFGYLAWYLKRQKLIKGKGIRIGIEQGKGIKRLELPLVLNTDFYPDPNPETTSVDGQVRYSTSATSWSAIRDGAGSAALPSAASGAFIDIYASSVEASPWVRIDRSIYLFDTSSIPDTDVVSVATLSLFGLDKFDGLSVTPNINIYASTPASNTDLVAGDYTQTGTTAFSTAISYASYSTTGYNAFALNKTGY